MNSARTKLSPTLQCDQSKPVLRKDESGSIECVVVVKEYRLSILLIESRTRRWASYETKNDMRNNQEPVIVIIIIIRDMMMITILS